MHDALLCEMIYLIGKELFGENFLSEEIIKNVDQVDGLKNLNNPYSSQRFGSRYYTSLELAGKFYQKIEFF
jgi:hypothetical protein